MRTLTERSGELICVHFASTLRLFLSEKRLSHRGCFLATAHMRSLCVNFASNAEQSDGAQSMSDALNGLSRKQG